MFVIFCMCVCNFQYVFLSLKLTLPCFCISKFSRMCVNIQGWMRSRGCVGSFAGEVVCADDFDVAAVDFIVVVSVYVAVVYVVNFVVSVYVTHVYVVNFVVVADVSV